MGHTTSGLLVCLLLLIDIYLVLLVVDVPARLAVRVASTEFGILHFYLTLTTLLHMYHRPPRLDQPGGATL